MEGAALFAWDTEAQEVLQTRQSGKDEGKQKSWLQVDHTDV